MIDWVQGMRERQVNGDSRGEKMMRVGLRENGRREFEIRECRLVLTGM